MATLQKLRNMGPLLVIFVGLALFAFIAGDAVKLFDSHSIDTSVGTVGDSEIDAREYQQVYNELDCFCKVSGYEIPEEDRDYYLERRYPAFGNLVPRDVASRAAKERCDKGFGVNNTGLAVFLDFSESIQRLGIKEILQRYGNLFEIDRKSVV